MRKSIITLVSIVFFILLLSYQPPLTVHSQGSNSTEEVLLSFDFQVQDSLFSDVQYYQIKLDSLKQESEKGITFMLEQQRIIEQQLHTIKNIENK